MANTETVYTNKIAGLRGRSAWQILRDARPRHSRWMWLAHAAAIAAAAAGCAVDPAAGPAPDETTASADLDAAAGADARPQRPPDCVVPWGIDWSDVLHVNKDAMVSPDCTTIPAATPYTPEVLWITNTEDGIEGGPVVYPPGYTPKHKAPMNDFLHKLDTVRYIVQPGDMEFSFKAQPIERRVPTVGDLYTGSGQFTPPQLVWPATALLGELPGLPAGSYSAEIHFVMSETHCDGQTTDPAMSCLGAGDNVALTRDFVVPE